VVVVLPASTCAKMPMFRYLLRSFILLLVQLVDLPPARYRESTLVQAHAHGRPKFAGKAGIDSVMSVAEKRPPWLL
jgi:hypothetical protein